MHFGFFERNSSIGTICNQLFTKSMEKRYPCRSKPSLTGKYMLAIGQLLVKINLMNLRQLNYITIFAQIDLLLPRVE